MVGALDCQVLKCGWMFVSFLLSATKCLRHLQLNSGKALKNREACVHPHQLEVNLFKCVHKPLPCVRTQGYYIGKMLLCM